MISHWSAAEALRQYRNQHLGKLTSYIYRANKMPRQTPSFSSPLVTTAELYQQFGRSDLVVLDATIPKVGETGVHPLADSCIPGARYFDLNGKFSDPNTSLPHNLPSEEQFTAEAQALGVNEDSLIVVYDHHGIYVSPRVWWMFRAMGHNNVFVLDGGLPAWIESGFATESKRTQELAQGNFRADLQNDLVWNADRVQSNLADKQATLIDARSQPRFSGAQPEPRAGLKQGHVPLSLNLPFDQLLHSGKMRSTAELQQAFEKLSLGDDDLVFTCGSGITACITMLAAELVLPNAKAVYDGSWAEWGQEDLDYPIATDDARTHSNKTSPT